MLMGITLSEVGGSQRVVYSIISSLPENIYEITLVTSPGGELLDWVKQFNKSRTNKIRVVALDCIKRDISPFYDLITFLKLIFLMKKNKYHIAHFHNSKMGIVGRMAAKICRVPKVYYTVHGWGLNKNTTGFLYPVLSLIEKVVARLSTKVIFVSKNDLEIGISNGWALKTNSCLIYNGVSEHDFVTGESRNQIKDPEKLPVIAFVARLAEPKDPIFAIQVSKQLILSGCNHTMKIIGTGPKLEACSNLIRDLGLEKHVMLLGKRDDVSELLPEADIFCLFSKWEGLPISIIEAMMCGLPVIANRVGGIPELVEHGKTGYLLCDLDVKLAAKYLEDLIQDEKKRNYLGNEARLRACERFNLTTMISQYRQLYEGK